MAAASAGSSATVTDIDKYLEHIRGINKAYRNVVDKLRAIKGNKKRIDERIDLLNQRAELQSQFIAKKQAVRALLTLLKSKGEGAAAWKENDLNALQAEFRDINTEFKELGVMADRDELFGDRPGAKPDDLTGATNTTLLAKAADKHSEMKDQLVGALRVVEDTKGTAAHIAGVLEGDREKMFRITQGLDEVESELTISGKLITNFAKRLYTDKVILAFAFLLVAGIAGIIVYATLNPNQKIFNVPDAAVPNIPGVTTPSGSATRTPGLSPSP